MKSINLTISAPLNLTFIMLRNSLFFILFLHLSIANSLLFNGNGENIPDANYNFFGLITNSP